MEKIKIEEVKRENGTEYQIFVNMKYCRSSFLSKIQIFKGDWAPVYKNHDELGGVCNFSPFNERTIYRTLEDAKKDLTYIKNVIIRPEVFSRTVVYSE